MKKITLFIAIVAISLLGFAQKVTTASDKSDHVVARKIPYPTLNSAKGVELFSTGDIVTDPGAGSGGADYSWAYDDNSWGTGGQVSANNCIATPFYVNAQQWVVDSIKLFAYQTGSGTTSTITDARVAIYDGDPSNGGTVVWGDTTTNVLSDTYWTGVYRGTDFTNTDRPIMAVVVNTTALTLPEGLDYYVVYKIGGSAASGPWIPPLSAGNDLQGIDGVWGALTHTHGLDIWGTETASTCPFVTDVAVSNIGMDTLDISWTSNGTETAWDIEVVAAGGTPTGTPTFNDISANPFTVTGLSANTEYDIYVRADCGGSQSLWREIYALTDLCLASQKCGITLFMEDDFGDGWNGAAIQLEQAGTIMGEYTVPVDTVTYHVNLCAGDSIDIIFVSGSYDEECALTVTDDYTTNTIYSFAVANAPAAGVCHTFYNECGTVGVNEITESSMIYPNPAQNTVTLEGFGQINVVEVYNMNGQLVKQVTSDNERVDINTENLNNGVYLFRVISEKGVSNNNVMIAR